MDRGNEGLVVEGRGGDVSQSKRKVGLLLGLTATALVACGSLLALLSVTAAPSTATASQQQVIPESEANALISSLQQAKTSIQLNHNALTIQKYSQLPASQVLEDVRMQNEVCRSPQCSRVAAAIIKALDPSSDPCQDFYQFSCGGWLARHPVPSGTNHWSQFDLLRRKLTRDISAILTAPPDVSDLPALSQAKLFYAGCLDKAQLEAVGLTPLTDFLGQYGGWPMTLTAWQEEAFDWQLVVAEARKLTGADYLVSVWVFADQKDTSSPAVYIDQTSLGLPRSVLTDVGEHNDRITAYRTYMTTTAALVAASLGQDVSHIDLDVAEVIAFEQALASITVPATARQDAQRLYNPLTVGELALLTADSGIDWVQLLTTMLRVKVEAATRVIVQEVGYLQRLGGLLATTHPRTVANYLMWRHVQALGHHTNQAMHQVAQQYRAVVEGVGASVPQRQVCSHLTISLLGPALAAFYVQTHLPQQAKDQVTTMVLDIRAALSDLLAESDWMDDETKALAVDKMEALTTLVGYPDWYSNSSALQAYLLSFPSLSSTSHFNNVLTLRSWQSAEELGRLGQRWVREQWLAPPTTVAAYYVVEQNTFSLPAATLQPPLYRHNTLHALSYGAIGQVVGHEMIHSVDDEGRRNDKYGTTIPWWSNDTLQAFTSRSQCLIDQHNSVRIPQLDQYLPRATLRGNHTAGESIADIGGLRAALTAYEGHVRRAGQEEARLPGLQQYSPLQLFFLSAAQVWCSSATTHGILAHVLTSPHPPASHRVLLALSNMREFSEVWGCPAGSPMNPDHKCSLW